MKIIGVCGGSGAGKSAMSVAVCSLGGAVIDADRVYRDLCVPGSRCLSEIVDTFGAEALTQTGELNRPALAKTIFADEEKRKMLNSVTHKHIMAETLRRIELYRKAGKCAVVLDTPLLFEAGFNKLCDVTVGVVADKAKRITRIVSRDGITSEAAEKRIASQISDSELEKICDFILENNGDEAVLYEKAKALFDSIIDGEVCLK